MTMVDMPTLRDLPERFHPDGQTTEFEWAGIIGALEPVAIDGSPSVRSSSERRDMAKIAVIGESGKVLEFGLAGAIVLPAEEPEAVLAAWQSLGEDVAVVVLTSRAARTLAGRTASWPLTAVMPP
jgi:hypothetical protein